MAERATEQIVIDATPEELLRVLLDFERYPNWAADIKNVEVRERDDEGRGTLVAYRAAAMGQSAQYALAVADSIASRSALHRKVRGGQDHDGGGHCPALRRRRPAHDRAVDRPGPLAGRCLRRAPDLGGLADHPHAVGPAAGCPGASRR